MASLFRPSDGGRYAATERAQSNEKARAASHVRTGSEEYDVGFHGDRYLLALVDALMPLADNFIETGANLGNTVLYVARRWPRIRAFSCEPGIAAFAVASRRAAGVPNCTIREATSPEFFDGLARERPVLLRELNFFHLDAHGYGFHWPLWDEVAWITSRLDRALILIDDLLVPGRPDFGYDEHEGQVCSIVALTPSLAPGREYRVLYPCYTEHTSPFHPLRGHGLLWFGLDIALPAGIERSYQRADISSILGTPNASEGVPAPSARGAP